MSLAAAEIKRTQSAMVCSNFQSENLFCDTLTHMMARFVGHVKVVNSDSMIHFPERLVNVLRSSLCSSEKACYSLHPKTKKQNHILTLQNAGRK
jgi:hypothetical protein